MEFRGGFSLSPDTRRRGLAVVLMMDSLTLQDCAIQAILPLPWIVDGYPVIGVCCFVLFGTFVCTHAVFDPLVEVTLVAGYLAWHV